MGRHRAPEAATFRLLYVCTGNICRSPFAEILTRHVLIGRLGGRGASAFLIGSAGVGAVVGSGMQEDSRRELAPWGLDGAVAERFVARQLQPALIAESDLVLGATPKHRSGVVERLPGAIPIAFSLLEFARIVATMDPDLLPDDPVARAHASVDWVRDHRGLVPPGKDGDRIADPMGGPQEAHHDAASAIRQAVLTIADVFAPAIAPTRPLAIVKAQHGRVASS